MRDEDEFRAFAHGHAPTLRRSAYLFCGDWHLAEDLVQTTLIKIYKSWSRVGKRETTHNYARTVLLRTWLDEKRRPWRRSERVGPEVPDTPDPSADVADWVGRAWERDLVHQALLALGPRQRAVLVLRYFDELSVAETAEVMGCAEGTVKSQAARGLAALRAAVGGLSEGELVAT
ncbi:RNA polymerase ECF sigma factor [Alloactinosynnema sp. L-07]|uniref:RNA polymerase sigma factor n=1 Tax=Alloactinosynnema sp. L-07 TaxID=1653480 RepID=UPI00065F031F|nr:SigE family RNA polymerase sigma factor [Alloactinosynnema sp. L-07]CRK60458.1 RNA polymerase ECF sigma factor [Alloactinosynnema sp. L-07]